MSGFLVRGARIVPVGVDAVAPSGPVDVLVRDGRVVEVGAGLTRPQGAEEYAADGRWLIPGLWDQHVHLGQWTLASQRLDLAGCRSLEEALGRVSTRLEEWPEGPVIGWGHRSATWDRQPCRQDLDEISGERSVVLISGDGHHAWLNGVAMRGLRVPERDGVV